MVRVFPTPGCPTINVYKFGYNGRVVRNHTFCSSTAAKAPIALHLRNNAGESSPAVCSVNDSIQDSSFLDPLPFVLTFPVFKAIRILSLVPITFIPPDLAIVWD